MKARPKLLTKRARTLEVLEAVKEAVKEAEAEVTRVAEGQEESKGKVEKKGKVAHQISQEKKSKAEAEGKLRATMEARKRPMGSLEFLKVAMWTVTVSGLRLFILSQLLARHHRLHPPHRRKSVIRGCRGLNSPLQPAPFFRNHRNHRNHPRFNLQSTRKPSTGILTSRTPWKMQTPRITSSPLKSSRS
jgi:hypothetical protein